MEDKMAEREGFEPPIELPLCLISSQVHSTGLCHLSALLAALCRHAPDAANFSRLAIQVYWQMPVGDKFRSRLVVVPNGTTIRSLAAA